MKVGLFVNTQYPEGFDVAGRIPEMVAQVRAARDAGFASLWFPHHWLTHPMQMLQITPVMGYVAAHAPGMTIGPNILILPPLNPPAHRTLQRSVNASLTIAPRGGTTFAQPAGSST